MGDMTLLADVITDVEEPLASAGIPDVTPAVSMQPVITPLPVSELPVQPSVVSMPVWGWVLIGGMAILILFLLFLLVRRKNAWEELAEEIAPTVLPTLKVAKLHEQGARSEQQDSFGVSDDALIPSHGLLAVVADGMGGLKNGDEVSVAAVETVLEHFLNLHGIQSPKEFLLSLACEAVRRVNDMLGPDSYRKSGSTLLLGYVRDRIFQFLSIGDSRVCLLRGNELMQLNREHSYENDLALEAINGSISVSAALNDPKGHGLVSFLGMGRVQAFDMPTEPLRLLPGDRLILMSDGVYNALSTEELKNALSGSFDNVTDRVRAEIENKKYSNQDNYTAVIIAYE